MTQPIYHICACAADYGETLRSSGMVLIVEIVYEGQVSVKYVTLYWSAPVNVGHALGSLASPPRHPPPGYTSLAEEMPDSES